MEATKDLYKDLICVAKDENTQEIKPMSHIFKINAVKTTNDAELPSEAVNPQNVLYVSVDPLKWHVTIF